MLLVGVSVGRDECHSKAPVHLGIDHDVNLSSGKNSFWRSKGQLFGEIEKLISGQTETIGISLIDSKDFKVGIDKLMAKPILSICHCQGLCLFRLGAVFGENGTQPVEFWKKQIQYLSEVKRIDGNCGKNMLDIFCDPRGVTST